MKFPKLKAVVMTEIEEVLRRHNLYMPQESKALDDLAEYVMKELESDDEAPQTNIQAIQFKMALETIRDQDYRGSMPWVQRYARDVLIQYGGAQPMISKCKCYRWVPRPPGMKCENCGGMS